MILYLQFLVLILILLRIIHLPRELTDNINGDELFLKVCSLTRKFRFGMRNKELIITLDPVNLDKHYIYYLMDLLKIINESKKIK